MRYAGCFLFLLAGALNAASLIDIRFNGMTALHGSVICNQPSQYLIDQGLYIANNRKDFPKEGEILRRALSARGLLVK